MTHRLRRPEQDGDLLIAFLVTAAAAAAVVLPLPPLIRATVVIPFVFVLPGYALVSALFARATLPPADRLAFVVGGSVAAVVVAGLVISVSPGGAQTPSWLFAICGITTIALVIARVRRSRIRRKQGAQARSPAVSSGMLLGMHRRDAAVVAASMIVVASSVVLGRVILAEPDSAVPEQLWLVPPEVGARSDILLGVRADHDGGDYDVTVSGGGGQLDSFELSLGPGETWQTTLDLTSTEVEDPIVARLFEAGSPTELRFVVLRPSPT